MLSFGGLLSLIANGGSAALTASNPGLAKLIGGAVFPVGLVMIVLQGLELLTSNMMVLPLAAWRGRVPLWSIPLNLIVGAQPLRCGHAGRD
jgi:formate/nitrite transporter FocA (FNT family)